MEKNSRIYVCGHTGMLGTAIWDRLKTEGYQNVFGETQQALDLCDRQAVEKYFIEKKPEYVFFVAAVAAGINYKKAHSAEILLDNMEMITNIIPLSQKYGVKKIINVCSALFYPSDASIPIKEEEATKVFTREIDSPYALAKATGERLCNYYNMQYGTNFVTVVPCNFFGPKAPFTGDRAGVVPSIIRRMNEAKDTNQPEVVIWGTGNACREFLHVDDVADACIFIMNHDEEYKLINVGRGNENTIRETAELIKRVTGYQGELVFDATKPEGRQHMQLNVEKLMSLGWKPKYTLEESLDKTNKWFLENKKEVFHE